ncbi:hypothetical protein BDZ85DRAFT_84640 [Elsinoe ampelina]|uniref:Uncharacterized protein n=1 Tax=Elsinoe ampelina TaxID=302913 RepID=A0A6A6GGR9_9PEZI|nr:hypothetical protein BDZ85DRAFT_84640 [Elsinoe ampelina]
MSTAPPTDAAQPAAQSVPAEETKRVSRTPSTARLRDGPERRQASRPPSIRLHVPDDDDGSTRRREDRDSRAPSRARSFDTLGTSSTYTARPRRLSDTERQGRRPRRHSGTSPARSYREIRRVHRSPSLYPIDYGSDSSSTAAMAVAGTGFM